VATVIGMTAAAIEERTDGAVVAAEFAPSGHLILTTYDETEIDAGAPEVPLDDATTTVKGIVELATGAEVIAGADGTRAVTPASLNGSLVALQNDIDTKAPIGNPTFVGIATFEKTVHTPVTVAISSAHAAIDASDGNLFDIAATANFTLDNPTNPTNGQMLHVRITQDGTGSRIITLGSAWNPGPNTVLLTTTANKRDHLVAQYHSGSSKWDILGFQKGF
jgi:hypothetical protein